MTDPASPSSPQRDERVRTVFEQAVVLPEARREAFVRARADDTTIAAQVMAMLAADGGTAVGRGAAIRTQPIPPDPSTARQSDGATGRRYGQYRILGELGRGAMGVVYEVEEEGSGRRLAMKLMHATRSQDDSLVERFRREARLAASIVHPRCVLVVHADLEAGQPFIVMEKTKGVDLQRVIQADGPLEARQVIDLLRDVLDGLSAAHAAGVLHRDIKPSNIMLDAAGGAMLADFGLSRTLDGNLGLTQSGQFVGTPHFASPEQLQGDEIDARSDLYSVAATAFFLLTGRPPFPGQGFAAISRMLQSPAPAVRSVRPDVPPELDAWIARGLSKEPARRCPDAATMRAELASLAPSTYEPASLSQTLASWNLDWLLVAGVVWPTAWVLGAFGSPMALAVECSVLALTTAFLQSRSGATFGKRIQGLAVRDARTGGFPGFARSLVLIVVANAPVYALMASQNLVEALHPLRNHEDKNLVAVGVIAWLSLVLLFTCRFGGRGVSAFERLTGLRTIRIARKPRLVARGNVLDSASPKPANQTLFGPYRIDASLPANDERLLVEASEPVLGRPVYLWIGEVDRELPLPTHATTRSRTTRLRYLTSGLEGQRPWHAFNRPTCLPVVAAGAWLAGRQARFLKALGEELLLAHAEGSLPDRLTIDHVRVQADGSPLLLDEIAGSTASPASAATELAALDLLRAIAQILEPPEAHAVVLPGEVATALRGSRLAEVVDALRRVDVDAVVVAGRHRFLAAASLSLQTGFVLAVFAFAMIVAWSGSHYALVELDLAMLAKAESLFVEDREFARLARRFIEQERSEVSAGRQERKFYRLPIHGGPTRNVALLRSEGWLRLRKDPAFREHIRELAAELTARRASLQNISFGLGAEVASRIPRDSPSEEACLRWLACVLDSPSTMRGGTATAMASAFTPTLSASFDWMLGLLWLVVELLMITAWRFSVRAGFVARTNASNKSSRWCVGLRFLVVEAPGVGLLALATYMRPYGMDADVGAIRMVWLIPVCGFAWALMWNAPWARRAPVDRLVGTDLMVR